MSVGTVDGDRERDPVGVRDDALGYAALRAVRRVRPRQFAAAGRLGLRAVGDQGIEVQTHDSIPRV